MIGEDLTVSDDDLEVVILSSSLETCISVNTTTDVFVEDEELFSVSVVSTNAPPDLITINPASQSATIEDITSWSIWNMLYTISHISCSCCSD